MPATGDRPPVPKRTGGDHRLATPAVDVWARSSYRGQHGGAVCQATRSPSTTARARALPDRPLSSAAVAAFGGRCGDRRSLPAPAVRVPPTLSATNGTVLPRRDGVCDVAGTTSSSGAACPTRRLRGQLHRDVAPRCSSVTSPSRCTGSSATCPRTQTSRTAPRCTDDGNVCTADSCPGRLVHGQRGLRRAATDLCDVAGTCSSTNVSGGRREGGRYAVPRRISAPATSPSLQRRRERRLPGGQRSHRQHGLPRVGPAPMTSPRRARDRAVRVHGRGGEQHGLPARRASVTSPSLRRIEAPRVPRTASPSGRRRVSSVERQCDLAEQCTGIGAARVRPTPPNRTTDVPMRRTASAARPATARPPRVPRTRSHTDHDVPGCERRLRRRGGRAPDRAPRVSADGVSRHGTVCRGSTGVCDVAEACNGIVGGVSDRCFRRQASVCRPGTGVCDVAELQPARVPLAPQRTGSPRRARNSAAPRAASATSSVCTGSGQACPADGFQPSSTTMPSLGERASAIAESCTGSGAACPPDGSAASTTVCRASAGDCDSPSSARARRRLVSDRHDDRVACPADQLRRVGHRLHRRQALRRAGRARAVRDGFTGNRRAARGR